MKKYFNVFGSLNLLILLVFMFSCSSQSTKNEKIENNDLLKLPNEVLEETPNIESENSEAENLENNTNTDINSESPDFWAKNYYHSTQLILNDVSIKDNEQDVWFICQGKTLSETPGYQNRIQKRIKYLATPLTFMTKGGFIKKVYVTKGMCRELGLYQNLVTSNNKPDKHQRFRKVLKEVVVDYIYTKKAYAKKLVFGTTFNDVTFVVE